MPKFKNSYIEEWNLVLKWLNAQTRIEWLQSYIFLLVSKVAITEGSHVLLAYAPKFL